MADAALAGVSVGVVPNVTRMVPRAAARSAEPGPGSMVAIG